MLDTNELMSLTILYLVRGQQDPIKAQNPYISSKTEIESLWCPKRGLQTTSSPFLTEINTRNKLSHSKNLTLTCDVRLGTCLFVQCKSLHIQNYSGISDLNFQTWICLDIGN